jgi:hypothetical protein
MKQLNREAFERARRFLKEQARDLDRALFEHRFEGAAASDVIAALGHYRNEDGGFGQALEPDLRTPSSSALATGIALRLLQELQCPADHPFVQQALRYLLTTFDPQAKVWRVAPPDTNQHPHAPWWHDEDGSLARTFDHFLVIPRAQILASLHHYAALVPADWLKEVTEHTVAAAESLETELYGGGGDSLAYALSLAEATALPQALRQRLLRKLRTVTPAVVCTNAQKWGSYCAKPLKVAPSPHSAIADLLWDDLQRQLDDEIEQQSQEGTWDPVWTWRGAYPEVWTQAKQEWRGQLTLRMLTTLSAFGRIEA